MAQELLTLATVPQDHRVQIFDDRITFLLFWISGGEEPIVFINPNITEFTRKLKNGVETESGGVTFGGGMQSIQFRENEPAHTLDVAGERLRITLQRKQKFGDYDMEIDLLVETVNSE